MGCSARPKKASYLNVKYLSKMHKARACGRLDDPSQRINYKAVSAIKVKSSVVEESILKRRGALHRRVMEANCTRSSERMSSTKLSPLTNVGFAARIFVPTDVNVVLGKFVLSRYLFSPKYHFLLVNIWQSPMSQLSLHTDA